MASRSAASARTSSRCWPELLDDPELRSSPTATSRCARCSAWSTTPRCGCARAGASAPSRSPTATSTCCSARARRPAALAARSRASPRSAELTDERLPQCVGFRARCPARAHRDALARDLHLGARVGLEVQRPRRVAIAAEVQRPDGVPVAGRHVGDHRRPPRAAAPPGRRQREHRLAAGEHRPPPARAPQHARVEPPDVRLQPRAGQQSHAAGEEPLRAAAAHRCAPLAPVRCRRPPLATARRPPLAAARRASLSGRPLPRRLLRCSQGRSSRILERLSRPCPATAPR